MILTGDCEYCGRRFIFRFFRYAVMDFRTALGEFRLSYVRVDVDPPFQCISPISELSIEVQHF